MLTANPQQYVAPNNWKFHVKRFKKPSIEYSCSTFDQPVMAFSVSYVN